MNTRVAIALFFAAACSSGAGDQPDLAPVGPPALTLLHRPTADAPFVASARMFWGDELDARVTNVAPGAVVTLRATTGAFHSEATFRAGPDGTVALSESAPESGSYAGVDVDGLLWSMTTEQETGAAVELDASFVATVDGQAPVEQKMTRFVSPKGVKRTVVREDGLVAVLYVPPGPGPFPALLTFGGSEGGLSGGETYARYYTSLGYACLALAYFGEPGLPAALHEVPLEYFQTALAWLRARPEVDPTRVGVLGGSRGGEGALLLGATFPEVKAVVAVVPSGLVWGATDSASAAAWTLAGEALPAIPPTLGRETYRTDADGTELYVATPNTLRDLAVASPEQIAAATIAVERTTGPILLLGGAEDELWPSCKLAQYAADRLIATGHSAKLGDHFDCFPDAGHHIAQPGLPTLGAYRLEIPPNGWYALGGTPAGIAHAARAADRRIRAFLHDSLGGRTAAE